LDNIFEYVLRNWLCKTSGCGAPPYSLRDRGGGSRTPGYHGVCCKVSLSEAW